MKKMSTLLSVTALMTALSFAALSTLPGQAEATGDACSVQRSNMIGAANDANRACSMIITENSQAECDMATEAFMIAVADYEGCTGITP